LAEVGVELRLGVGLPLLGDRVHLLLVPHLHAALVDVAQGDDLRPGGGDRRQVAAALPGDADGADAQPLAGGELLREGERGPDAEAGGRGRGGAEQEKTAVNAGGHGGPRGGRVAGGRRAGAFYSARCDDATPRFGWRVGGGRSGEAARPSRDGSESAQPHLS